MKDSLKAFEPPGSSRRCSSHSQSDQGHDEARRAVRGHGAVLREGVSDHALKSRPPEPRPHIIVRHVRVGHSCRGGPWHAARVGDAQADARAWRSHHSPAQLRHRRGHDRIDEIVIALPPDLASVAAAVSDLVAQAGAHRRRRHRGARIQSPTRSPRCRKARASSSFTTRRGRSRRRICSPESSRPAAKGGAAIAAVQATTP